MVLQNRNYAVSYEITVRTEKAYCTIHRTVHRPDIVHELLVPINHVHALSVPTNHSEWLSNHMQGAPKDDVQRARW